MNLITEILGIQMKTKVLYYFRWILSGVAMLPLMLYLEKAGFNLILNLFIGQSFGALIFYNIDKRIFREDNNEKNEKENNI